MGFPAVSVGSHGPHGSFFMSIHRSRMAEATRMGAITMSDDNTANTADTTENQDAPAQGTDWVQEARKWEKRAKDSNAELKELREKAAKLDELEAAQKTEAEKLAEKLEQATARAAELERAVADERRQVLVQRVAAEKKVPAKYLTGDTEEDLVRAADEFLNDIQAIAPERPSGVVPTAGTGDPKPRASSVEDAKARAAALYAPGK